MHKVIKYIVVTVTILSVLLSMMVIPAAAADSDAASEPSTASDPIVEPGYGLVPFCIVVYPGSYTFKEQIELVIDGRTTTDHFLFSSNGRSYDSLRINTGDSDGDGITNILFGYDDVFDVVYNYNTVTGVGTWVDDSYRYITVDSLSPSLIDPVYFTDLSYDSGYLIYGIWTSVSDTLSFEEPFTLSTLNFHTMYNFLDVYSSIYVEADGSVWYKPSTGAADCVYTSDSGWLNSSYRTLIFDTSVSSSGSILYGVGYEWFTSNFEPLSSVPVDPEPEEPDDPSSVVLRDSWYFLWPTDHDVSLEEGWEFDVSIPGGFTVGDKPEVYNRLHLYSDNGSQLLRAYGDDGLDKVFYLTFSNVKTIWLDSNFMAINFLEPLTVSISTVFYDFFISNYNQLSSSAFDVGLFIGIGDGYSEGYAEGEDYGIAQGKEIGYTEGYNAGASSELGQNFFGDLFGGIGEGLSKVVLLEYPVGDTMVTVTVWSVFGTIVVIMIVVWVLKLIAGG